ncbi:hypothetical protein Peur_074103 [Populus x canadensis]
MLRPLILYIKNLLIIITTLLLFQDVGMKFSFLFYDEDINHVYYTATSRYTITKKVTFLQKPNPLTICHVNKVPSIPPAHASN